MISTKAKTHEPFIAGFTGQLMTFVAADGARYVFQRPGVRIVRHAAYMMELDPNKKTVRMIPVRS